MKLTYKIDYGSTNSYFKEIITDLIKEFGVNATCEQYKGFIALNIDEEEEKLEAFFKFLESKLPLSIFIGKSSVVEGIEDGFETLEEHIEKQNIAISASKIIDIYQNSTAFEKEAKAIKSGEIVEINTSNGIKKVALPSYDNRMALGEEVKLMIINLNAVGDLLATSPRDIQLLSSIERPLVKLKFNILRNTQKEYSNTNFIHTKLPDDEISYELATALRKEGVDFLIYSEEATQNDLEVTYNDEQALIVRGDKALFPRFDYTLNETFASSNDYFDKSGGVFKATLSQLNKRLEKSIGIYMSTKSYESSIAVNVPGKGVKEIIKIPNVMTDFDVCIEDIEGIDENTERLVQNYKEKFPQIFETKPSLENTHGFETILNLTAHMIGLKDANELESTAHDFKAKSGLDVSYKVAKIDDMNYLDYRKVIQSIMSYKIAGVENPMLAFSVYESLSEFIVDNVMKINSELKCRDVVLCGDMFANSILLSKTQKELKTLKSHLPKEYPLDIN